jgi:hypothetical protein
VSEDLFEASAEAPSPEQLLAARGSERGAELARAVSGPASRLVAEMRLEQILRYGHDAESDAMLPIDQIPRRAQAELIRAMDFLRGTGESRNLPIARLALGRVAAMCMAAVDRLDLAMKPLDTASRQGSTPTRDERE